MSHHVSFGTNFTWSHALDYGENNTTGASATALLDPASMRLEYGNSNQNVPYRYVAEMLADASKAGLSKVAFVSVPDH